MNFEEGTPSLILFWQTYKVSILLGCGSMIFVLLSITIFIKGYQSVQPIQFSQGQDDRVVGAEASNAAMITADIEGAVAKPGVYALPGGARVEDLLVKAGGFTKKADLDAAAKTLNRAAKLADGSKIFVPVMGQNIGSSQPPAGSSGKSSASLPDGLVSINQSSASELESLPGVGPVTAGKIISARPYNTLEELVAKKAVGQALFLKLKDRLTL